jgi:ABC-type Na+ efflux pump permease subunit
VFHGIIDRLNDICVVANKELKHCFRDAHVLIYTIFVPLILYPIFLVSMSEYTLWREGLAETRPVRVAIKKEGSEKIPELIEIFKETKKVAVISSTEPIRDLEQGKLECVVDGINAPETIGVVLNPSSDRFIETQGLMQRCSFDARSSAMKAAIKQAGVNKVSRVFEIETRNVGTMGGRKANLQDMEVTAFSSTIVLVAFYAYTMLIITVGAIYPALAAFTEETEKKTKATTYLLPVERSTIVFGKFVAVTALTTVSGMVNFLSMAFVAIYFTAKLDWLKRALTLALKQYSFENIMLLILTFVLSTLLVASLSSLIASLAKSFKEAQNISSLVLLTVTIFPMVALLPGWTLDMKTAFIPILNMVLSAKAIVTDSAGGLEMTIACVETLTITAGLLYLSQIIFWGREPSNANQEMTPTTSR